MTRVAINPALIRWARERAWQTQETLASKFKKLPDWEAGRVRPTLKQVEAFARAVHVPIGYLFLTEPPEESLPIPDFRTVAGQAVQQLSPNLLDTLYACQERQSWYRGYARVTDQPELGFVNSATVAASSETVAAEIRATLGFDLAEHHECQSWTDALRLFIQQADQAGILVMVSGVVMSNPHRRLDPAEFRGFALCDPFAPLIFINGADTKAAQMFTLAHELAHLWLGSTALSNMDAAARTGARREEIWCNAVAAELLVPLAALRAELNDAEELPQVLDRLTRTFKVSTLVILRRLLDAGWLHQEAFDTAWAEESTHLHRLARQGGSGGDFYRTTLARVSRRFARAVVGSTLEGQTLYRDAYRMLGVSKAETFNRLGREIGVMG